MTTAQEKETVSNTHGLSAIGVGCNLNSQTVAFHLTHACNLRCSYCYSGEKRGKHMTSEVAERGVDFVLAEALSKNVNSLNIMFFGGEPLLMMDLLCRICDMFHEKSGNINISFSLSTNGVLLTPSHIEKLAKHKVYVSLSLDGIPEAQDKHRKFPDGRGTSEILNKTIPGLLEWNPCADARFVVTPSTAGHVSESVSYISSKGFKYITMALDYSADWNMNDLKILKKQLKLTAKWYEKQLTVNEAVYLNCFDERIRSRTKAPLECNERCSIGLGQYSIAPSGRIYPCVQFVGDDKSDEYLIGTVSEGFDKKKRSQVFEISEQEKHECLDCELAGRCSCWCACTNYSTNGCIDKASPIVCEYERIAMPIADSIGNKLWKKRSRPFIHRFYNPAFPVLDFTEHLTIEEISDE